MRSSSLAASKAKDYIDQLTAIRGLACLAVLFGHVVQTINYGPVDNGFIINLSYNVITGAFNAEGAVLLFFVLSGCVLALSFGSVARLDVRDSLSFYVRRIFRLYPLLWFATLVAIVSVFAARPMAWQGAFVPWLTRNVDSPVTWQHSLLSFAGIWTEYDGPIWSLRVELIYSALFPVIYLLICNCRTRLWFIATLLVVACLPYAHPQYGTAYGVSFAIGALIALSPRKSATPHVLVTIVALIILCYDRTLLRPCHLPDAVYNIAETFAAAVIVQYVLIGGARLRLLSARPVIWIGDLSYSIYLLHLPILLIVLAAVQRLTGLTPILLHPVMTQIFLGVTTCVLTVSLSSQTYKYIELPLHQTGRRLGARLTMSLPAGNLEDDGLAARGTST